RIRYCVVSGPTHSDGLTFTQRRLELTNWGKETWPTPVYTHTHTHTDTHTHTHTHTHTPSSGLGTVSQSAPQFPPAVTQSSTEFYSTAAEAHTHTQTHTHTHTHSHIINALMRVMM